jgi:hypothetical protein
MYEMNKIIDEYPSFEQCLNKIISNNTVLALLEKEGDITPEEIRKALTPKTNYERALEYIKTIDISNGDKAYIDLFFYLREHNYKLSNEEFDKLSSEYPFIIDAMHKLMENNEFNETMKVRKIRREDMSRALLKEEKEKHRNMVKEDDSKKKILNKKDEKNE